MKKTTVFYVLICFSLGLGLFAGSKLSHGDNGRVRTVIQCGLRTHVENICFNSDESIFASYDEEGIIKLWDLPKGRLIKTLSFKREYGELLSFDKEDNIIFRYKNRLYLIDPFEDQVKKVKEATYFTIPKNFMSSDGKTSLTLHERYDNYKTYYSVKVWNIETDRIVNELNIEMAKRLVVTLSATGKFAAFLRIEKDSLVDEIYNLKQGILVKRGVIKNKGLIKNFNAWYENNSNSIALSSDAKQIVLGPDILFNLHIYNTSNFKSEKSFKVPGDFYNDFKVYFSADGRFLSVEEKNRSYTECWQIEGWKKISDNFIDRLHEWPRVFISPNSRYFIYSNSVSGGWFQLYEGYDLILQDNHKDSVLTIDNSSWIHLLALSADGKYMALVEEPERSIKYYSLINGKLLWEINNWERKDGLDLIASMSINGNGKYLSVRTNEGKAFIWDIFQKSIVLKQSIETSSFSRGIALSNSGDYLAIGSRKETIIVSRRDGSVFKKIPIAKEKSYFNVISLQFSADDRFIAIGISNYFAWYWSHLSQLDVERESQIDIWDLKKQKIVTTLKGFADDHYPFGFNSNCDAFIAGDKIFSLPDGKFLYTYDSIQDLIKRGQSDFWTGSHIALAFSIGMNNIAKAWYKKDGIEIIDSKNGDIKATIFSFSDSNIAVSPEGFFTGDGDFTKRVNFVKNNRLYEKKPVFNKFCRPDLVERKLKGADISN